jgi:hypothetical protein
MLALDFGAGIGGRRHRRCAFPAERCPVHDGRTYDLGTGYANIAVGVDDLEQTLAELKAQGIEPEREP